MPRPSHIHAVVFDLDDTLYSERDYVRGGYQAAQEALERQLGVKCPDASAWLWGRFQRGAPEGAFDALSRQFSLGLNPTDIALLVKAYREHRPTVKPYGGAAGMLARLHADYRLGLLSDGFLPAQRLKLEALKLGRFFDAVIFTEELGADRKCWKPSPAGFEAISRQLGVEAEACAYIGDNPAKDFLAPNALGWLSVQFLRPGQVHSHKSPTEDGLPQCIVHNEQQLHRALLEG